MGTLGLPVCFVLFCLVGCLVGRLFCLVGWLVVCLGIVWDYFPSRKCFF